MVTAELAEEPNAMEYPPVFGVGQPAHQPSVAALLDPQRYLLEADLALLYGSREDVIALIAQAYLAFDLLAAECHQVNRPGTAISERNS
jgi:hypothetical protein